MTLATEVSAALDRMHRCPASLPREPSAKDLLRDGLPPEVAARIACLDLPLHDRLTIARLMDERRQGRT